MASNNFNVTATGDLSTYRGPTAAQPLSRVAVAGDWHGSTGWARKVIRTVAAQDVRLVLHLGDFGLWPRAGTNYRAELEKTCRETGSTILVTPGNHEWWDAIDSVDAIDRGDGWGPVKWFTDHIGVLPRGHRFTLTSETGVCRSFVSLGGAPSVDFTHRREGHDWWPSEQMTESDVDAVIAGGTADVMLTHDAPDEPYATDAVRNILADNPWDWPDRALAYAGVGRRRVTRAFEGVAPAVLVHGHYHVADEVTVDYVPGLGPGRPGGCRVVSLHRQDHRYNTRLLYLDSLQVEDVEGV